MAFNSRSRALFAVILVFLCLSFTAVALRCFVRLRLVKAFGWDDVLMVLAMVRELIRPSTIDRTTDTHSQLFNIWFATCGLAGTVAGFGKRFSQFDSVEDIHTALLVSSSGTQSCPLP
jgi:hypothetical protein